MSALPTSTADFEERLNQQLIQCLNIQTNVIQNLARYSQHISMQLFDIKHNVESLTNQVIILQEQQCYTPPPPLPIPISPFWNPAAQFLSRAVPVPLSPPPPAFSYSASDKTSATHPFVFTPIHSNPQPSLSLPRRDLREDLDDVPDVQEPTIVFEPLVHLSPVETKTGEEDETVLFAERAKLYRFDSSTQQMKERGIGPIKILQHNINGRCRIVMRREQVLKVCANHQISAQMELKAHQDKDTAWIWSAVDFADGEGREEVLCVRFKTRDMAERFREQFNRAKMSKSSARDEDDVLIIGEAIPTLDQIHRAKKLQLPPTFYLYESNEPCPGCRGCDDQYPLFESDILDLPHGLNLLDPATANAILANLSQLPLGFFPNGVLPPLMSMLPHWYPNGGESYESYSPPKSYRPIIKAKRSLPANRLPPPKSSSSDEGQISPIVEEATVVQNNQKKSRNVPSRKDQPDSLDDYATQMAKTIVTLAKEELYKQWSEDSPVGVEEGDESVSNNGFSFTNFERTVTPSGTGFQFAQSISSPTFIFGSLKENSLPTQAVPLLSPANPDKEIYEPTVSFKPLVHLSPVETNTGEEDETVLFAERAKLYRFDSPTQQMKERGIGPIKILQHNLTGRCRIVMRREQVLKVCANHQISAQMELKAHQEKDTAWIWSAVDFADGEGREEVLCVRFKTREMAERFREQFNRAKEINGKKPNST